MVQDLDDTSAQHPTLHSQETMDDGTLVPVTIFSYQRFKFKLYRIASPIIGNVYFLRGATKAQVVERVGKIHQELASWFASLPQELRLEKGHPRHDAATTDIEKTFQLQALALQLAFDNLMILLHLPLLPYSRASHPSREAATLINQEGDEANSSIINSPSVSKNQCWESAIRTSRIINHIDVLRIIKHTHAAAYTGIHMLTAGIMLSLVALSQPLSTQAHEAKQAIGQVIRVLNALRNQTVLSAQSGKLLEGLVKVILAKEMDELLSEQNILYQDDGLLATENPTSRPSSSAQDAPGHGMQGDLNWSSRTRFDSSPLQPNIYDRPISSFDTIHDSHSPSSALGNTDFNKGLISLQEGTFIRGLYYRS